MDEGDEDTKEEANVEAKEEESVLERLLLTETFMQEEMGMQQAAITRI